MLVGVIGNGVVGNATARVFIEYVDEVRVYDRLANRSTHSFEEVAECRIVFICLPTPRVDEGIGTHEIESVLLSLEEANRVAGKVQQTAVVIKSTVPVGTTRRLANMFNLPLVHSPEFLTARCAVTDAHLPSRNIVGEVEYDEHINDMFWRAAKELERVYLARFPSIKCHFVTSESSELAKLVCNAFFATKVSFFNEISDFADRVDGADFTQTMACVLSDGRISHSHTNVPGPDGLHGFGGECLPKDLRAFAIQIGSAGGIPNVLKAAIETNEFIRQQS